MPKSTKVFILILISALGLFVANYVRLSLNKGQDRLALQELKAQPTLKKQKIKIGGQDLEVEVARSVVEQAVGLSFRDQLGSDGMLFILPTRQRAGFWMKDMKFDIDIVWISEGKIAEITAGVKADSYQTDKTVFYPKDLVDWVLELESGRATALGLKVGDLVILN